MGFRRSLLVFVFSVFQFFIRRSSLLLAIGVGPKKVKKTEHTYRPLSKIDPPFLFSGKFNKFLTFYFYGMHHTLSFHPGFANSRLLAKEFISHFPPSPDYVIRMAVLLLLLGPCLILVSGQLKRAKSLWGLHLSLSP